MLFLMSNAWLQSTLGKQTDRSYSPLEQTPATCLQLTQAASQQPQPVAMTTSSTHQSANCQSGSVQ